MVSTPVAIGPFTGGLNNYSDPSAIGDNECAQISNFDIDLDGTLVTRPPIIRDAIMTGTGLYVNVLAVYVEALTGTEYIVYSVHNATRAYNTSTKVASTISDYVFTSAVMYKDLLWMVTENENENGAYWSPTTAAQGVPDMPKGVSVTVYKERLFIANAKGRVFFSGPANPESWGSSDFFDVRSGDGQDIVKIMDFSGQIAIFKTESTYIFQYDSAPTRGAVQVVSSSVGADNSECVAEQDGIIYVYHNQTIYAVNNWRWEQINVKVVFDDNLAAFPVESLRKYSLSILGYRLVARYGSKYYVYGLKTKIWTQWDSTSRYPDFWVRMPEKNSEGLDEYYAGSYRNNQMYKFMDRHDALAETFPVSVTSKMYDYQVPYSFKRLFWWGIDIIANNEIRVIARPQTYTANVTWGELEAEGLTWGQAESQGRTWGRPADRSLDVSDEADIVYTGGARVFVRFIKAMRFRKISFYLESEINTTAAGPLRIFSMVSNISNRQLVPKKVN